MKPLTRGEAVARLKEIAARLGKPTVSREEFARETGLTRNYVMRRLGRYSDLLRAAGLCVSNGRARIPDDDLMAALRDAVKDREGRLTFTHFKRFGPYSVELYRSRWGGWQNALAALARWLEVNDPVFPYRDALRERLQAGRIAGRRPDRKSTRLNSSHRMPSRMPSSA